MMGAEVHGSVPATHWSNTCGPDWWSTMSSIQSVPGQPDLEPSAIPMHHGDQPPAIRIFVRLMSYFQVRPGDVSRPTSRAGNIAGSYQMTLFSVALTVIA